jgi:hypothetical protein
MNKPKINLEEGSKQSNSVKQENSMKQVRNKLSFTMPSEVG